MGRPLRVHYEGAVYNIVVNGEPQQAAFGGEADKEDYLAIIKRYKSKYDFNLFAYVLLENEAHLLIKIGSTPLATIMQAIQQVYTRHYNQRYDRIGAIFAQRYQADLCLNDVDFVEAIKKIHELPTRQKPSLGLDYRWSSHKQFMWRGDMADTDEALQVFSRYKSIAIGKYNQFMRRRLSAVDREALMVSSPGRKSMVIAPPEQSKENPMIEFQDILAGLVEVSGLTAADLVVNTKVPTIVSLRRIAILLACQYTTMNKVDIARELGVGASTVTNTLNGRYKSTEAFEALLQKVETIVLQSTEEK